MLLVAACHQRAAVPPAPAATPAPAGDSFFAHAYDHRPSIAKLTDLGRRLFSDPILSVNDQLACSSCHDARRAFGPPAGEAMPRGGASMTATGYRAVPSLRYQQSAPPFSLHFFDEDSDESVDQGPTGGRTWDGRVNSAHDQARMPILAANEMANPDPESVAARVAARYGSELRALFGDSLTGRLQDVFDATVLALEVYQQDPTEFYPFSSRYDAWLRGKASLSPKEMRGLKAFTDPRKGNCASCHPNQIRQGAFPLFTDFGYTALGVPRNRTLPANRDPEFHDLGLCGPVRTDLRGQAKYCGLFRVPSLRNVAVRGTFFHNGVMRDLRQVVRFYARRDTHPQEWYPAGSRGEASRYDDLPERYVGNVNHEPPFDRQPGQKPALSEADVADIVAFLGTLTDADVTAAKSSLPKQTLLRSVSSRRPRGAATLVLR